MDSINDIISKLSAEDIDELKNMAAELFGSNADEPMEESKNNSASDFSSLLGDAELMSKIARIMSAMNREDDRVKFIGALKPLLSKDRRKRADDAMQLLKVLDILPLINSFKEK